MKPTRPEPLTEPPEHLDAQARRKWAEVFPILQERGNLDAGSLDALAAYCSAWSRWTAAEQQVNTLGTVVKSPAGFPVANPYVGIAAAAQRQMRQWGDAMGLLHKSQGRRKSTDQGQEGGQGGSLLRLLGNGTTTPATKPRGRKATA